MSSWPPCDVERRHTPVAELVADMQRSQRLRLLVARLPVDPDLVPEVTPRPSRLLAAGCVALGGLAGASARAGLAELWADGDTGWAWSTLVTNLIGCAALAGLSVTLMETRPLSVYLRPLLGTGLLGGFTTFSTFAVDAIDLIRVGRTTAAAGYVAATVVGTTLACLGGLVLTRWLLRTRSPERWYRQLDRARVQVWDGTL